MDFITILLILLVLLVAAKLAGELFERLHQPAMVGEMLVGVILGPSVLGFIDPNTEGLMIFVYLGLFFVVFLAGVEMNFSQLTQNIRPALSIALMSFIVAFSCGIILGSVFKLDVITSVIIGIVFSLSALPIAVRIYMDLNKLDTKVGRLTIMGAVIDDVLAMIFLSIVISIAKQQLTGQSLSPMVIGFTIVKVFIFLLIIYLIEKFLAYRYGLPSLYIKHYIRKLRSKEAQFSVILIFGLIIGIVGEFIGITFIVGAFYAGLLISEDTIGENTYKKTHDVLSNISIGFLGPIFFAYIGLLFYLPSIINVHAFFSSSNLNNFIFLLLAISLAIIGKTVGSFIGAKLANIPNNEGFAIGIGLNARGLMGIVIALVAYQNNLINSTIFSVLVAVSFITTIMAPLILRRWWKDKKDDEPPPNKKRNSIGF